jgi:hypothetical protein
MGGERSGDCIVGLAFDRPLPHVDGQLTVGSNLDERTIAAAGFDSDDHGFGHAIG